MIRVNGSDPTVVAFEQKGIETLGGQNAQQQIAKAARAEVDAMSVLDNATYRLTKATEQMKAAEILYYEAVAKSSSNVQVLKAAYNNALAGYRDADKAVEAATENVLLAKASTEGLRSLAKAGISDGASLKAAIKNAKSDADKAACVAAAERLKLPFFLPKGWAAQYKNVEKRTVSTTEREALAAKGKAMPDGSYPIANTGDLKNAIQSYGRAKDPKAVKSHITARAKDLNATNLLPDNWAGSTSVEKDAGMMTEDATPFVVLCPGCHGSDDFACPNCGGTHLVTVANLVNGLGGEEDEDLMKSFSTASLLTRDFQKSEAYQNYIFKGGPGSGAIVGHEFFGNQWTGGMKSGPTFTRGAMAGKREGWKTTMHRYIKSADAHKAAADAAVKRAHDLHAAGRHSEASAAYEEAKNHYEGAASAHRGISEILKARKDHPGVVTGFRRPAGAGESGYHSLPKGLSPDRILGEKGHYNEQTKLRGMKEIASTLSGDSGAKAMGA